MKLKIAFTLLAVLNFYNAIAQLNKTGSMDNKKIVYDFAEAINEHNVDKLYGLMTDDHQFIDAQGNEVHGRDKMKAGWAGYFQWFPDYKIEITHIFVDGDTLAVFGFAGGTFKSKTADAENYWRLPAAWKVVVENGRIKLWQVYADTKIPFDIISKNQ